MLEWLVSENMYIYAKTTLPFYVNILVSKITELTERHTQLCEWKCHHVHVFALS